MDQGLDTGHANESKGLPPKFSNDHSTAEIQTRFGVYRTPTETTIPRFEAIQKKCLELAELIDSLCPNCREKSTALTQVFQARMSANAAISMNLKH